jgi:methylated-DNA-protein-cysteine methyltransferase-like protein
VVWILSAQSGLYKLPWHRVINSQGKIGLKGEGYKEQKKLLQKEGVVFSESDKINFRQFLWNPRAQ